MSASWQVGVDIGGTFTDIVAVDAAGGAMREAKVKSVAGEPEASLDAALAAVGLDWEAAGTSERREEMKPCYRPST